MAKKKAKSVKPAKVKKEKKKVDKRTSLEKAIDALKYIPSQRNWEEALLRANDDHQLAKRLCKAWLFWALERRKSKVKNNVKEKTDGEEIIHE